MAAISRFQDIEAWKTARRKYITEEQFKETCAAAETCARQIANFIKCLEANPRPHRISDDSAEYEA